MTPVEGVDYAFHRPSISGLAAVGKRFACRYVGAGTADKHLTPTEAQELTSHGLAIVSNVEGVADGLLGGFDVGASWARSAHAHAVRCGMPPDRPIYLSVDFDVTANQWSRVADALRGAASVLGDWRVGVYGGYDAIAWSARDRVARWWWQTYAWSEGRWHPLTHIQQYRNGVSLVGGTVDLDRAMVVDYGQWTVGAAAPGVGGTRVEIRHLQEALQAAGYDPGPIDGIWGPRTRGAWAAALKSAAVAQTALQAAVESLGGPALHAGLAAIGADVGRVGQMVGDLEQSPAVDPVAVAAAIAAHPEVAATLARNVAAQLAAIQGEITLTGSLSAGIRPPVG